MNDKFKIYNLVIILLSIILSGNLYGYSATKHHRHMGVRAANESNLDRYLKDNLGFSKGINTTLTNPGEPEVEQTKKIYEWIGYGAVKEDSLVPYPRVLNHFYDPVSGQGLMTLANSLEWAKDQSIIDNDYSWTKARENYYLALTSQTKEEREKYWALTFRSLGQVLHLVQDLASPAHVRNDNHLSKVDEDPYESLWGTSSEGESFIKLIMLLGELGNTDYQYPVVELDQFNDYWDTEDGRGLAEFTNSNFVSKDTNLDRPPGDPHHYDNPQGIGEYREPFTFTDSTGRVRTIGVNYVTSNVVDNYAPGRSVNPFNYLTTYSYFNFYTERYDLTQMSYTLNRKCHEEYAKLLVPRTVGYGAGLLNYFFRGELDVEVNAYYNASEDWGTAPLGKLKVTNNSEFPIEGRFEVYRNYDNSDDIYSIRQDDFFLVRGIHPLLISSIWGPNRAGEIIRLDPGQSIEDFVWLGGIYYDKKIIVVFNGEDGNNVEIVIGKIIRLGLNANILRLSGGSGASPAEAEIDAWSNYNDTPDNYYVWHAIGVSWGRVGAGRVLGYYDADEEVYRAGFFSERLYCSFDTSYLDTCSQAKLILRRAYNSPLNSVHFNIMVYKANGWDSYDMDEYNPPVPWEFFNFWGDGFQQVGVANTSQMVDGRLEIIINPTAINLNGITYFELKAEQDSTETFPIMNPDMEMEQLSVYIGEAVLECDL